MKFIYVGLLGFILGCGEIGPMKWEKERIYIGKIESCEYLPGSKGSSARTIIKTNLGSFPVYGTKTCFTGKSVWIRETTNDSRWGKDKHLEVEGENKFWEMTN